MIKNTRRRRQVIGIAATVAVAALGVSLTAVGASAGPDEPTDTARQAKIAEAGDAYMGWKTETKAAKSAPLEQIAAQGAVEAAATPYGMDVASHQGNVDWAAWWDEGMRFAYVKATEGTYYENEYFAQQYNGSYDVGMIRGSYHFATPDTTSGAEQAEYFVANGGGWSGDGKTLPGALDIEYNPYGDTCYGLSQSDMVAWIADFTSTYKELTGRDAVIYSTTDWWSTCTGNTDAFGSTNPLWIARYSDSPGELPAGWGFHTFWQYSSDPIDQNVFNGDEAGLQALADG